MGRGQVSGASVVWALVGLLVAGGCAETPTSPAPARWSSAEPGLTCPAPITVIGVIGLSQAVSYGTPSAAGDTAVEQVVCTPASGSVFALGTTAVLCRGVDRLGRETSCGFTVSLTPAGFGVKMLVAFGDSVTLGENGLPIPGLLPLVVDPVNAYPTRLQERFDADFPGQGVRVVNEGRSGERASDGVVRLPAVLALHRPGAVLLLTGYNDLFAEGLAAGLPVASALRDMVRAAKSAGVAHVFVSTITPSRPGIRQIDPGAILLASVLISQMAAEEGAVLVDAYDAFFGQAPAYVSDDGLHLSPAGNLALAETFYTAIRNTIPVTTGTP